MYFAVVLVVTRSFFFLFVIKTFEGQRCKKMLTYVVSLLTQFHAIPVCSSSLFAWSVKETVRHEKRSKSKVAHIYIAHLTYRFFLIIHLGGGKYQRGTPKSFKGALTPNGMFTGITWHNLVRSWGKGYSPWSGQIDYGAAPFSRSKRGPLKHPVQRRIKLRALQAHWF